MGKLQTGRFERLSARTYSIKGPGALVDLDETVLGVLQLERQGGMESHYMQEWETFSFWQSFAASAGNYNWFLLNNPPGSGRIAVVDWYQNQRNLGTKVNITRGVPPGFNLTLGSTALDTRIPVARQPACGHYGFVTNIAGFGVGVGYSTSTDKQHFKAVLGEDGSICFRTEAVNEPLSLSIRWAERNSAPFER